MRKLLFAMFFAVLVYGAFVIWTGADELATAASKLDPRAFIIALLLSSANYVLRFGKWEYYLKLLGLSGIPKFNSFLIFLSGFVLTVTPGKVGEVFKSAVLEQTYRVDLAKTAPIVIAERLTDVIGVVGLVLIGSAGFQGGLTWALFGAGAAALGVVLISFSAPALALFAWLEARGGRAAAATPRLRLAYASLQTVGNYRVLAFPAALSLIGWGLEGYALQILLQGLGEDSPLTLSLFFYATATLAGALVPTPGGLGVAETLMQSQLVALGGVAEGTATLAMLLIRFATLWWAVVVGFFALFLLKLRFPKLLASVQATHDRSA